MTIEISAVDDTRTLDEKLDRLNEILGSMGRVLVAYSGGVDSAFLAVAAHRILGDEAIAVTADSASYATGELELARELARRFGFRHEVVQTLELENPDYARNPTNRCYYCKHELFTQMSRLAGEFGASLSLYGQNADDVGDFRPGADAARELGARAPLQEAGLTKQDIRELARRWDLPVWDRPATACLASRFPYGTPVTADGLHMVDRAEKSLRDRDFEQLRVRHHTEIARVELPPGDVTRLLSDSGLRAALAGEFAAIGYGQATVDLRGFRSGSMNEVLIPAPAHEDEIPGRIETAIACENLGPAVFSEQEKMVCLRLHEPGLLALADRDRRTRLVQQLEDLGFRYVAIDLDPLD